MGKIRVPFFDVLHIFTEKLNKITSERQRNQCLASEATSQGDRPRKNDDLGQN